MPDFHKIVRGDPKAKVKSSIKRVGDIPGKRAKAKVLWQIRIYFVSNFNTNVGYFIFFYELAKYLILLKRY